MSELKRRVRQPLLVPFSFVRALLLALPLVAIDCSHDPTSPHRPATPYLHALAITTGYTHSCAITDAHRLNCWGSNEEGQLGDGSTTGRNKADVSLGALEVSRVAAGGEHTCALTTAGELYCWGRNEWGQVGDGSVEARLSPVQVSTDAHFVDIFAGGETSCAMTAGGEVYCWGFMVGTSSAASYQMPAKVSGDVSFKSLNVSEFAVCGVSTNNIPYCLKPTATADGVAGGPGYLWRPQPAPSSGFISFAGGLLSDCGLDASSLAECFGDNQFGELGIGDMSAHDGVSAVAGDRSYTALYAGYDWTCGTTSTGDTYCWGHNNWGALGPAVDQQFVQVAPTLLAVPSGLRFTAMDGGLYHMCGIGTDSIVYCWGAGMNGQLGDGHSTENFYSTSLPAPVHAY